MERDTKQDQRRSLDRSYYPPERPYFRLQVQNNFADKDNTRSNLHDWNNNIYLLPRQLTYRNPSSQSTEIVVKSSRPVAIAVKSAAG